MDQILNRRVVDLIADIRDLEEKINAKLYALYKLTDADIELLANSVFISKCVII